MRRSGRTYRSLLKAAHAFSNGKHIFFVCLDDREADRCRTIFWELCDTMKLLESPHFSYSGNLINYKKGNIRFVTPNYMNRGTYRGARNLVVIVGNEDSVV